jgi:anti-sigma factor RsiW
MRCRAVERQLLAGEDRAWTEAEKRAVEAHLAACPACRRFQEARQRMRAGGAGLWGGEPPATVSESTRRACLDAIREDGDARRAASRVPAPVIAASVVFSAVTIAWVVLSLVGAGPVDSWTSLEALPFAARAGLLLIAQNVFVLLLAPVILRRPRGDREGSGHNGSTVSEFS